MILLGLAFGVAQAGLIDHSLFNTSYRDIDYWQELMGPTYIPALGIAAYPALNFILGHAIWSFSVPIALVETLVPERSRSPWLGRLGMAIVVALYLLVAVLIFMDHVESEQFLPSPLQLAGAVAVILAFTSAAFLVGRRSRSSIHGPMPNAWWIGVAALAAFSLPSIIEVVLAVLGITAWFVTGWPGVILSSLLIAGLAIASVRWSRRTGWGAAHHLALTGGALLSHVWLAFFIEPLGDVPAQAKLLHNVGFALGALVLLAAAARTANRAQASEHVHAEAG